MLFGRTVQHSDTCEISKFWAATIAVGFQIPVIENGWDANNLWDEVIQWLRSEEGNVAMRHH
jgi:hypothetical protein